MTLAEKRDVLIGRCNFTKDGLPPGNLNIRREIYKQARLQALRELLPIIDDGHINEASTLITETEEL